VTDAHVGGLGVRSDTIGGLTTFVRAYRRPIELVFAIAFYFGFACYMTWPLVTDLSHIIYGAAGDPYGTMSFYRELVAHHHNPFLSGVISQYSAPAGQPIPWPRDLASLPGVLSFYLLTVAFGAVSADGLYILLGYTLTGVAMFLFARRLTQNTWASLIAGWAFAFYPFAVLNGQGHLDLIQGWVLVLGIWRMLELMWNPSRRNGLLAGLAVALGMWWSAYFILFGGVAYAVAAVVTLLIAQREHKLRATLGPQAIAAAIVLVFAGFLGVLSTKGVGSAIGLRTNGVLQLNTYSARPLEYLLPDAHSPLFGGDTVNYLTSHIHGSNPSEATLYVGVTVVVLALVALVALLRRKLSPRVSKAALVLFAVAAAALITSAPPQVAVLGVLIPFPSHFISQVTSTWRVYSRFVIIVMLALSTLTAVGLGVLTNGRARWVKVGVMLVASIAVPLDLWARLVGRTNTLSTPGIYQTLARQPKGLVAEYPLTPAGYNNYGDVFFQNVYEMPMINGYLEGSTAERRALSLANLADPSTAPRLAALGVRYVLVDAATSGYGLPPPGKPGRGFRVIEDEPYADLYVVTAKPSNPALPALGEGFGGSEPAPTGAFYWLEGPSGTIELAGACTRCRGVLTMTVGSFARPRTVRILDDSGHVLAHAAVASPTRVAVALQFERRIELKLTATPGAQSIRKTIGGADPRSVSVQVSNLEFADGGVGAGSGSKTSSKQSR
jgi:hypothetical protein